MDVSRVIGQDAVTLTFDAARSGDDGSIMLYHWDFGDGTSLKSATPGPVQKIYSSGNGGVFYTVSLTVTDNSGLTATTTRSIKPAAAPPTAAFTATVLNGPAPLAISFNPSGSSSDEGITSYAWSFGDGTTRADSSPVQVSKTFTTPGTYVVSLQITDGTGRTATANRTITVTAPPPAAEPHVSGIEMKLARGSQGRVKARATVNVVDGSGRPATGATVIAQWLDPLRGVSSGRTRSGGKVDLTSPSTAATGCLRLNVVAVRVSGRLYRAEPPVTAEVCRP
jgi:PKD repeat protein